MDRSGNFSKRLDHIKCKISGMCADKMTEAYSTLSLAEEGGGEEASEHSEESAPGPSNDQWLPSKNEAIGADEGREFEADVLADRQSDSSGSSSRKYYTPCSMLIHVPLDQEALDAVQEAYDAARPCACGVFVKFISSFPSSSENSCIPSPRVTRRPSPLPRTTGTSTGPDASKSSALRYWVQEFQRGITCPGRYQKSKQIVISTKTPGFKEADITEYCRDLEPSLPKKDQFRHLLVRANAWTNFAPKFKIPDFQ